MSGENQARPQRNQPTAPQPAELALLQHAQQLHLRRGTQFADFIEKQRALARLFQLAFPRAYRACEGALFMPE